MGMEGVPTGEYAIWRDAHRCATAPANAWLPTIMPLQPHGSRQLAFAAALGRYAPAVVSVNSVAIPEALSCGAGVNGLILKSTDPHACHHMQSATTARSVAGERVDCCDGRW